MLIPTILMHKLEYVADTLALVLLVIHYHISIHITIRQHMYTNILVINNNTIVNYTHMNRESDYT